MDISHINVYVNFINGILLQENIAENEIELRNKNEKQCIIA